MLSDSEASQHVERDSSPRSEWQFMSPDVANLRAVFQLRNSDHWRKSL